MMATRAARHKNQLPPCYYEGFLEKRSFKDKTSRKLWACLCGNTLFFFNDKKDTDYIEKLDLSGFISITDDNSPDRHLDAARLNLQMTEGNVRLTVPSAEARELWKGFIQSVTELSVPSSLNLLPGQIHMIKEAVESEKERKRSDSSGYVTLKSDMPACYFNVSRLEAELLLEREAKRGNVLLRPGSGGNVFAVSTRQDLDGPVFRHYRVTRKHRGGFTIDVDNPVPCATLHHVISYLVEKTDGVLVPLIIEEQYEKNIYFIQSDNENGEKSVQQASSVLALGATPKPVPLRIPMPEPVSEVYEEEPTYMNDSMMKNDTKTEDSLEAPLPQSAKKKAMMPPVPAPRKWTFSSSAIPSSSSRSSPDVVLKPECQGQIPLATLSELKLKLGQKVRSQD